jgi:CheY-like chemotaxis protein
MTAPPREPTRINLLLVDDETQVRQALTRALDRAGGFAVVSAAHGRQALEILERQPVDAILTDLQMPVMDGVTLIARLLERDLQPPIAVMTGFQVDARLRDRLGQAGIAAVFSKPVDVVSLADELQRLLAPSTVDRLTSVTLSGLLQLLEIERRSGLIVVHPSQASGVNGRLYFKEGSLAHAETPGLTGLPAACEILGWPEPTVEIFPDRVAPERTIELSLQHLLLEWARLDDERGPIPRPRHAGPDGVARPSAMRGPVESHWAVQEALEIPAVAGAALLEAADGAVRVLAAAAKSGERDPAFATVAEGVLRAHLAAFVALGRPATFQELLLTTAVRHYLLQPLGQTQRTFLFVALDRPGASLELARVRLGSIAGRASRLANPTD